MSDERERPVMLLPERHTFTFEIRRDVRGDCAAWVTTKCLRGTVIEHEGSVCEVPLTHAQAVAVFGLCNNLVSDLTINAVESRWVE